MVKRGAVIVTPSGCYFSRWEARLIDYELELCYIYPQFTDKPDQAYVYESEKTAKIALKRIKVKSLWDKLAVVS